MKDLHVLATTQRYSRVWVLFFFAHVFTLYSYSCSRLQSSSDDTLLRSCHFVHDVLFEDFPADIFLQRPAIVKVSNTVTTLGILGGGGGGGGRSQAPPPPLYETLAVVEIYMYMYLTCM